MYGVAIECIDCRLTRNPGQRCDHLGLDAVYTVTVAGVSLGLLDDQDRPTFVRQILTALAVVEKNHGSQTQFVVALYDHLDCGKFGLDPHTRDNDQADIHMLKMQQAADLLMADLSAARPDVEFSLSGAIIRPDGNDTVYQDIDLSPVLSTVR